ncbi:MAG: response regulator transcription factor [Firmicutes bacterium]|nr:response regulator transcription factor [Bacillota bacterium]
MTLRALILDDEYPARAELRYLLSKAKVEVEVVGEASHAEEALKLMKALDYSLVFLDIELPGLDGIALAEEIRKLKKPPQIIFVTAYEQYALKAFDVNAVDYLLKPVNEERLNQALARVAKTVQPQPEVASLPKLVAEKTGKTVLVNPADVVFAFVEDGTVYLKGTKEVLATKYTLKELEDKLAAFGTPVFFRAHRGYLVNLEKVKEIVSYFHGAYSLIVEDDSNTEIPVSRGQSKRLRELLNL